MLSQALPVALSGRDIIGVAKTGSGKTLSYIWPLLVHMLHQPGCNKGEGPIGLILCPTRELCSQVYTEANRFGKKFGVKITTLVGGENKQDQWKELKSGLELLIATPGRLIDIYKKKGFNFYRTTFLVIDEADKMFGMGFEPQIKSVLGQLRPDRQILLFSATYKKNVRDLSMQYLRNPIQIMVGKANQVNEDIKQEVIIFEKLEDKMEWLIDSVPNMLMSGKILIFVNQIKSCTDLYKIFKEFLPYIDNEILHGDKLQFERSNIIKRFKKDVNVLIATDVASRGLDIPSIRFVINYENTKDGETYIHRIGRTGRAGNKDGVAVSCILKHEIKFAAIIANKFEELKLAIPPDLRVLAEKGNRYIENIVRGKNGKPKRDCGIKGKDQASLLLKRALESGQIDKKGLGFEKKRKSKGKKARQEDIIDLLYGNDLNTQLKDMITSVKAEEFKIKADELYGRSQGTFIIKKKVKSGFTDPGEKVATFEEVEVTATEMKRHALDEKKKEMKADLKNKFFGGFKKSGTLKFGDK